MLFCLRSYRGNESRSSGMVSAHLRLRRGEMTHLVGNRCGRHVDRRATGSLGNSKFIRAQCSCRKGRVQLERAGQPTSHLPRPQPTHLSTCRHVTKQRPSGGHFQDECADEEEATERGLSVVFQHWKLFPNFQTKLHIKP